MYLFRMRHLILTLLGLMTVISLGTIAWGGKLAVHSLSEANHLLLVNDIAELTLQLNIRSALERTITTSMLASPRDVSDTMWAEMLRLRRDNEIQVIELLATAAELLESYPSPPLRDALDRLRRERQGVLRARGTADLILQGGKHGEEVAFFSTTTAFIEAIAEVRSMAIAVRRHGDVIWHDHLSLKHALYAVGEYTSREQALLAVAIAQARSLTVAEREISLGLHHTASVALEQLEVAMAAFPGSEMVGAAFSAMSDELYIRYPAMRDSVYAMTEQGTPYLPGTESWYQEASRGIRSIIELGTAINVVVRNGLVQRVAQARNAAAVFVFAAVMVFVMLTVALLILRSRITFPLRQLEQAAESIGQGDYGRPLHLRRGDELGELGAALERMRINLLEQTQERDRIEALLRTSAQRFRNLVESTNDWLWEIDGAGRYSYVSPQIMSILGYAPDEVLGRTPFELMPADEAARMEAMFAELMSQRAPLRAVENINLHKDGRRVVLETNGVPVLGEHGEFSGYRGIDRDITERRQAEQAQRESERRFRDLLENMQLMAVMLDDGGNITFINDFLLHSTGRTRDAVLGQNWFEVFIPEELRGALRAAYLRTMAGGAPVSPHEHEILTVSGGRRRIVWNVILIHGPDERAAGSASVGSDVTEQRKSEMEMHKLLRVVEQTDDSVMITDPNGNIEYVNAAFERISGYQRDEVIGRTPHVLSSGKQDKEFYTSLWGTISSGRSFYALMINRRKNGELFHEEKTITPLRDASGTITHYVSTSKDVTERRRMDEQLQQSEKLASIGQLAAGVAHEINNPVGYISSNISTLTRYLNDIFKLLDAYESAESVVADQALLERLQAMKNDVELSYLREDIHALIDESAEGVARVKKIVQDLKDFSRQEEAEWQMADLHKGLESTLNIVHNEIKYKAEVVREYGELPLIECIPSQINQVFMNLLVNAAHAIDEKGVIHVRSGTGDGWVWVEVEDNGAGIPPEHMKHLFEPFFTTKPVGKGTGLGLSISYGIVQKHGGRIELESEPGKGSRFRVWLPQRQPLPAVT